MFFLLSKLTYIFIQPANWVLALLLWRILAKSPTLKKRLSVLLLATIFIFGNNFLFTKLVLAWQPAPVTLPPGKMYAAGILLGGIASFDSHDSGYFNTASDRFIETSILYQQKKIKHIIISGGSVLEDRPKEFSLSVE